MNLSYKNLSRTKILNTLKDIRFLNGEMVFGFYNTANIDLTLTVDPQHLFQQADVFARQMYQYRSDFDLKRFLGSYQEDWIRIMSEAYVYDRLKAIFYGMFSIYKLELPDNLVTFPGHALLVNLLAKGSFSFSTNDSQPFTLYVNLKAEKAFEELAEPFFQICPDLRDGLSINNTGSYNYCNPFYETVLRGFYNGRIYLENNRTGRVKNNNNSKASDFFEMCMLNDDNIKTFTIGNSNPIANSFLSKDLDKFYFVRPDEDDNIGVPRFDESVFITRALGFIGDQLEIEGNNVYKVAKRNKTDIFTKEEVFSITGIKSELVPYTMEEIDRYLGIDHWNPDLNRFRLLDLTKPEGDSATP